MNLDNLKGVFSPATQLIWNKVDTRPTGEVELLVGQNYAGLHPNEHESNGNIKVMKSKFGTGYVLSGCHSSVSSARVKWDTTVSSIRTTNMMAGVVNYTKLTYKSVRDYLESNDLSVLPPRRCNNCMNCTDCGFRGHQMSLQEQYEYQVMENKVVYDEENKEFRIEYAFTEDPSILTNNLGQVIKIAE